MDVGCSAFLVLMLFAVWNYVQRPSAPRLALCGLAMGAALAAKFTAIFLLLPPLVRFTVHSIFADGLGIRYLIGVLRFTCLAGGLALASLVRSGSTPKRCVAGALCAWSVVAAVGIYPDQLSYFNEMACLDEPGRIGLDGGSRCGTLWLDDSNVDWGQGLKQLSDWMEANAKGRPIRLAYFGSFPPEVYGFPPQSQNLTWRDLMQVPAPGLYAVSTHLYAHTNGMIDRFRQGSVWMRITRPRATVGHAFYIYDIP